VKEIATAIVALIVGLLFVVAALKYGGEIGDKRIMQVTAPL